MAKLSKQAVEYESPARGRNRCEWCIYWESFRCSEVEEGAGLIRPEDWCKLFTDRRRKNEGLRHTFVVRR